MEENQQEEKKPVGVLKVSEVVKTTNENRSKSTGHKRVQKPPAHSGNSLDKDNDLIKDMANNSSQLEWFNFETRIRNLVA